MKILTTTVLIAALFAWSMDAQAQKDDKDSKSDKEVKIEKRVVVHEDSEGIEHYETIEHAEGEDDMWNDSFGGPYHANIPDLTDDQKKQLDKLRTEHQKKARLMHANLQEKRAKLNTLRLSDNPDMPQINKTIDEIAGIQADLMKEREAHRAAIRAQLNDEQKEWFDSRPRGGRGFGHGGDGYGRGEGFRRGDGYGPRGEGFGPGHGMCRGRCCK